MVDITVQAYAKAGAHRIKVGKGGFLSMLLGTLGASLLGLLLTGKGTVRSEEGFLRTGEGIKTKSFNTATSFNKFRSRRVL